MRPLINRTILLVYCFISGYLTGINTIFIITFLTALSIAAFNYYLDNKLFRIISTTIFGLFACFFPPMLFFIPLICYDMALSRHLLPWIPTAVCFFMQISGWPLFELLYVLIGIALSTWLSYQTECYERLEITYRQNRDDGFELNQILKDKNRSILESQNYELRNATLKERNRIAREIHDNVGHLLSRSILMIGALKAVNKEETLKPQIDMLDETLNQAMDNIRSSVHDLHDNSINLKESLESLVNAFTFCDITLTYDMQLDIPNDIKYSFISITKEALTNISKHSNASRVRILVREHPAMYQLVIEDNGTSFSKSPDNGIGLVNMHDRINTLNGNILIETDSGFRIFITIPKLEERRGLSYENNSNR